MKKSHTLLAFLALALAVATVLPGTWAYFTANARAGGGRTVQLQNETEINEEFDFGDWEKRITVTAADGTQPVWVRARAYAADEPTYHTEGTGWQRHTDGWYYFDKALAKPVDAEGKPVAAPDWTVTQTDVLRVEVHHDLKEGEEPEDFDVVVVYETTPVTYNEDGSRILPTDEKMNWSPQLITSPNGGAAE